jgi:predicted unusual protein kinase regulating ubiquinone biosynthesis (AarF/ABC1/UbiB family)
MAGSDTFAVPPLHREFSTGQVLAMTYMPSDPLDTLTHAAQAVRDRAAAALIDLVLQELFAFHAMQTDPNLANYRVEPATGRLVLLDFGAVRTIDPGLSASFRALLNAGLDDDADLIRNTMLQIGYFNPSTAPHHQALIQRLFRSAIAPLRQETPHDFGQSGLLERLRDMGMDLGRDRDLMHVPPAETLFLHRKIGGMYLMAAKLRARVDLRALVERYR